MKYIQKKQAFTLVELIVVITILAVLATVAFISLTGYSQEAKNSKVQSDLRSLATAIETNIAREGNLAYQLVDSSYALASDNNAPALQQYKSGAIITGSSYIIGSVNFVTLGQNSEEFTTPTGNKYLMVGVDNFYQLAGEVIEDGQHIALVKGNYFDDGATNVVDSLFSINGSSSTALLNGYSSGSTNLY